MQVYMNDPRWRSDDSVHRVWVNDRPGRVKEREAQGYRVVKIDGSEIRTAAGHDLQAVLMEVPQAVFQALMSPDAGKVLSDMRTGLVWRDPSYSAPIKPEGAAVEGLHYYDTDHEWSWWRLLHHTHEREGYTGLVNWTKSEHWFRVVFRPSSMRYLYMRLRWKPRRFWCEWRERTAEVDRLNAKFADEGQE